MKQFPWGTCYKTAAWPMTKQFSILTYDITAVWPMTKQFSNLTYDKTAVWPMTKQFYDITNDKNAVWPMINLQFYLWQINKHSPVTKMQFNLWQKYSLSGDKFTYWAVTKTHIDLWQNCLNNTDYPAQCSLQSMWRKWLVRWAVYIDKKVVGSSPIKWHFSWKIFKIKYCYQGWTMA